MVGGVLPVLIALGVGLLVLVTLLALRLRGRGALALLGGLMLAALGGEAALRALDVADPARAEWIEPLTLAGPEQPAYWPGAELVYRYPSDPRGYFDADGAVVGRINSLGLRGPECRLEKRPGTTRVAVLGDSFTLGIGVKDEDTLPARLGRVLASAGVEVLNFGVSATQTVDQVRYLEGYVRRFEPDVVLLVFFLNDAERDSTMDYLVKPRALVSLRRWSFLLNGVVGLVERALLRDDLLRHYREGYTDESAAWREVRDALRRASDGLERRGAQLVVAVHPVLMELERGRYPLRSIHAALLDFCRAEGIPALDLLEALEGTDASALWVHAVDRHPNELCNELTAQALARFLLREELLR